MALQKRGVGAEKGGGGVGTSSGFGVGGRTLVEARSGDPRREGEEITVCVWL